MTRRHDPILRYALPVVAAILAVKIIVPAVHTHQVRADANGPRLMEIHYAPAEDLEDVDLKTMLRARYSIELAAYSLTDKRIIECLIAQAERGVYVNVYLDRDQTESEMRRPDIAEALMRLAHMPTAKVRVKANATLQHMKAYSIDAQLLRTGSANFSPSAERQQDNDLLLTNDPSTVLAFEHTFQALQLRPDSTTLTDWR